MVEIWQCGRNGTDSSDRATGAETRCLQNKIKMKQKLLDLSKHIKGANTTFPTHWDAPAPI